MKIIKIISLMMVSFLFFFSATYAHSSHSHGSKKEVSEIKVKAIVTSQVNRLIAKQKLEKSWGKVEIKELVKKKFGAKEEWVATLVNPNVSEKDKSVLYVFINLYGDFVAANFTGK